MILFDGTLAYFYLSLTLFLLKHVMDRYNHYYFNNMTLQNIIIRITYTLRLPYYVLVTISTSEYWKLGGCNKEVVGLNLLKKFCS